VMDTALEASDYDRMDHSSVNRAFVDARTLPYDDGRFDGVISNSIIHHIPRPTRVRVRQLGPALDNLRPLDESLAVTHIVQAAQNTDSS